MDVIERLLIAKPELLRIACEYGPDISFASRRLARRMVVHQAKSLQPIVR